MDDPRWDPRYGDEAGRVPSHTLDSLRRYVEDGIPTGHFLHAVLTNNLSNAFGSADSENGPALQHIVAFVYWVLPSDAWGSPEKVSAWLKRHADAREGNAA